MKYRSLRKILPFFNWETSVSTKSDDDSALICFCGGKMGPLIQQGRLAQRHWRERIATALACARCCHVAFVPPSAEELIDYYRDEYGKGSEAYYTCDVDYEFSRVNSRADIAQSLAGAFHRGDTGAVILELGCAFGGAVAELRRRGCNAYGIDLSRRAIAEGRSRGNTNIYNLMPAEFTNVAGETADVIYSFHMLEHVRDLTAYLTALHDVLSDGGVAMFRVPNGAYLRSWLDGFESWDWFAFPDHLHMLSPTSSASLIKKCGFELVGLRSNTCGESLRSITDWLVRAVPELTISDGPSVEKLLSSAGCLMELEFVLRKPGRGGRPSEVMEHTLAAHAYAERAALTENAIRRSPIDFIRRCFS
jgi:SAM-dependent methyltransferase